MMLFDRKARGAHWPGLLVLSDPFEEGWDGREETLADVFIHKTKSGGPTKAWTSKYRRDAHFACYGIPGEGALCRLKKEAPANLPRDKQPALYWVAVDWDTPNHEPWESDEQMAEVYETLSHVDVFETAGFYFTRAGFRLVWPLARPLPVALARDFLTQFHEHLHAQGIETDVFTDWNRLFRMPRTVRDGQLQDLPYDFDHMAPLNWTPRKTLKSEETLRAGKIGDYSTGPPDPTSLPPVHPDEYDPYSAYEWCDAAKSGDPLAPAGGRNQAMCSAIGAILALVGSTDPTLPYRLLHDSVVAMHEAGSRCDPEYLWSKSVEFAERQAGQQTLRDRVLRPDGSFGSSSSTPPPRLGPPPNYAELLSEAADSIGVPEADVVEHLIIDASPAYYVFDEYQLSYSHPTNRAGILRGLRRACPYLCPTTTGEKGGNLAHEVLIARYSTAARETQLVIGQRDNRFDPETKTVYEGVAAIREDLVPRYNEQIHTWLKLLGNNLHDRLLDWLATLLDFSQPTCVMYLHSPPSTGKGLLAAGIGSLWNQPIPTPYKIATQDFNEVLTRCPVIWADEHVPNFSEPGGASIFRQMVGGVGLPIGRKYRTESILVGAPRVLITANNARALQINEQLTPEDLDAVIQRVGYIQTTEAPAKYLESLGGWKTTHAWTEQFQLAEHLLWLRENRKVQPASRYIVPGWPSDLTRDLTTHAGLNALVLISMIHYILEGASDPMMPVGNGEVLAHTRTLMRRWQHYTGQKQIPSENELADALRTLSIGKARRSIKGKYARLWQLDVDRMYLTAQKYNIAGREELEEVINRLQAKLEPVPTEEEAKRQSIFAREKM